MFMKILIFKLKMLENTIFSENATNLDIFSKKMKFSWKSGKFVQFFHQNLPNFHQKCLFLAKNRNFSAIFAKKCGFLAKNCHFLVTFCQKNSFFSSKKNSNTEEIHNFSSDSSFTLFEELNEKKTAILNEINKKKSLKKQEKLKLIPTTINSILQNCRVWTWFRSILILNRPRL